jgi:hypothetical protein
MKLRIGKLGAVLGLAVAVSVGAAVPASAKQAKPPVTVVDTTETGTTTADGWGAWEAQSWHAQSWHAQSWHAQSWH